MVFKSDTTLTICMDCSNLRRRLKEDDKLAAVRNVTGNMGVSRLNEALMRLVEYSFTI